MGQIKRGGKYSISEFLLVFHGIWENSKGQVRGSWV